MGEPLNAASLGAEIDPERDAQRVLVREVVIAKRRQREIDGGGVEVRAENALLVPAFKNEPNGIDKRIIEFAHALRLPDVPTLVPIFFIHQPDGFRILDERMEGVLDQLLQGDHRIAGANGQIVLLRPQLLIHALENGDKQPLFRSKIIIQHVLAKLAAQRNGVDARAVEAFGGELAARLHQDLVACAYRVSASAGHTLSSTPGSPACVPPTIYMLPQGRARNHAPASGQSLLFRASSISLQTRDGERGSSIGSTPSETMGRWPSW